MPTKKSNQGVKNFYNENVKTLRKTLADRAACQPRRLAKLML